MPKMSQIFEVWKILQHFFLRYGDLIRENRNMSSIEEAKPVYEGVKIATNMIPIKINKC